MSGPTTVIYDTTGDVFAGEVAAGLAGLSAVILAARAIREARDLHAEYGEAYARVRAREADRFEQRRQMQEASRTRTASLHRRADRLHARLARLQGTLAAQTEGGTAAQQDIARPASADEAAWLDYISRLETAIQGVERQLSVQEGISAQAMAALLAEQPDASQILAAYAQQRAYQSRLSPDEIEHYRALSLHLLSRLELPEGAALPVRIETLAREMLHASDAPRAEALASDLRLEIQRANERRKQQAADAQEAAMLLVQLADAAHDLPTEWYGALEQVAAGVRLLDESTRAIAHATLAELRAARGREEQEAMSLVLEQSLRDLGYEVDGIAETLFVSGGVAHFQKQSWRNYHVRMRVNAEDKSVNFNVVRARGSVDGGSGDAAQDKRLDHLAEDRWCSEFPALLKTLQARGIELTVTRQLQAGELPVQVVDAATLPKARSTEEQQRHGNAPRHMHLDDLRK